MIDAAVPVEADGAERRRSARRRHMQEHRIVSAAVRPGHPARVIDVSAEGALLETNHRLLPGMRVEVQLTTPARCVSVRGVVLRCAVATIRASVICYRGAIGFDRHLPWLADEDAAPGTDHRSGRHGRVEPTHQPV